MATQGQEPRRRPALLPLAAAAVATLLAVHVTARDPRYALPFLTLLVLMLVRPMIGRWRMRKLLLSGDVERVIGTWEGAIRDVPNRETLAPLMLATAYASYGWVDQARRALGRAVKGPAWETALEQRLFVETLLDAFEGDRAEAMRKAAELEALPVPAQGPFVRRRVTQVRNGLAALARAFAHASREDDARVLAKAAGASPLVHWAMRYAAAIVAVDAGRSSRVAPLLAGAPPWPEESAFHAYHDELLARAEA